MATNVINTRIQLKYDTVANWNSSTFIPKSGEVCIATIDNRPTSDIASIGTYNAQQTNTPPAVGVKVGDGVHTFANLPWIQAIAGDVYAWAKSADGNSIPVTRDAGTASAANTTVSAWLQSLTDDINGLSGGAGSISTQISSALANLDGSITGTAGASKTLTSFSQTDGIVSAEFGNIAIGVSQVTDLVFDGTYNSSTNKAATVSTVTNAINALDVSNITGFGAGKTLASLTETDGKISATFQDISIALAKVTGAGTAAAGTIATSAITDSDSSTDLTTKAQVAAYVATKTAGLTGAMHYRGAVAADPTSTAPTGTYASGDVVTYSTMEYVYDGTNWRELGKEGSYALSTVTVTGTNGLTGGGDLSANRTISHASRPSTSATADATFGTASGKYIKQIKVDAYGHTFAVAEGDVITYSLTQDNSDGHKITFTPSSGSANTITIPDNNTTYTFAEGNTNGAFSVTPSGGVAQSVAIHGLSSIATSGSIYDVTEVSTMTVNNASVEYLLFNCGSATTLVEDTTP